MLQPALTLDRSVLLLEELWDRLERVIGAVRDGEEQPHAISLARSRIETCRLQLREGIAVERMQVRATVAHIIVVTAMCDVADLLDCTANLPVKNWMAILCESQDVVLASLRDLRNQFHSKQRTRSASAVLSL